MAPVIEQTREFLTSPEAPLLERGMKLTYTEKSKERRRERERERQQLEECAEFADVGREREREGRRRRRRKASHSWYK